MSWKQPLAVALITYALTKGVDLVANRFSERREIWERQSDMALQNIQEINNQVGGLYELGGIWKGCYSKATHYKKGSASVIF